MLDTHNLILRDKLKLLSNHIALIAYSNIIVSSLSAVVLWQYINHHHLIVWCTLIILLTAVRVYCHKRFDACYEGPRTNLSHWSYLFTVFSIFSGLLWGWGGWFFIIEQSPYLITFIMITWISMVAGTIGSQGAHFSGFLAYAIPTLTLLNTRVYLIEQEGYQIMAFFAFSLLIGFIGFARTQNKALESSLKLRYENRRLLEELSHKNERLEQEFLKAEEANRQKSHFLAASSHDLRQPLQALIMYSELLSSQLVQPNSKALLTKMDTAIGSLNTLLSTLLDISRLEAGDIKPHISTVAIHEIFTELASSYSIRADEQDCKITVDCPKLWVSSDPVLLMRCCSNLIENALQHASPSQIKLSAKSRADSVELTISDNGKGVEHKHHDTIFQEFQQLDNPERDRQKGLGLGLFIVKKTLTLLSHPLQFSSGLSKGCTFKVQVPLCQYLQAPTEHTLSSSIQDLRGINVWVIDDEQSILDAQAHLLQNWGMDVTAIRSALDLEALLKRKPERPELIISDYRLPNNHTGAELINTINTFFLDSIPALLMTGDTDPERVQEARSSGFTLLHKPVKPAKLRKVINTTLLHYSTPSEPINS